MMRYLFLMVVVLLATTTPLLAQDDDDSGMCPALVEEALMIVDESCSNLDLNVVCYGNGNIEAQGADESQLEDFVNPGDIRGVADIYTLTTEAMDVEQDIWGIAVLALQANIPDTLPGQNVTFLLYGDTQITVDDTFENADGFDAPFQAFRFSSGVGEPACTEAPRDGLLVQSPEGVTVNFMVNGIEVELGSTVLIQGDDIATNLTNIEGSVSVTVDGVTTVLEVGQSLTVDTVDDVAQVQAPTAFDVSAVRGTPINAMPEVIALPAPGDSPLRIEFCNGMSDIPVQAGQPLTLKYAWYYADEGTLNMASNTATIDGAGLPLWSIETLDGFGRDYVFVTDALEPGSYEIVYSWNQPNVSFTGSVTCTIVAQ